MSLDPFSNSSALYEQLGQRTAVFPTRRIRLTDPGAPEILCWLTELMAPVGFGTRGLIMSPCVNGRLGFAAEFVRRARELQKDLRVETILLAQAETPFVKALSQAPDTWVSLASDPPDRHLQLWRERLDSAIARVLNGEHVMMVIDSITRAVNPSPETSLGDSLDKRLKISKRFFGSARALEEGGSLTVIATVLSDTGHEEDATILRAFKGTGNMELTLSTGDTGLCVAPGQSGTHRAEYLAGYDSVLKVKAALQGQVKKEGDS